MDKLGKKKFFIMMAAIMVASVTAGYTAKSVGGSVTDTVRKTAGAVKEGNTTGTERIAVTEVGRNKVDISQSGVGRTSRETIKGSSNSNRLVSVSSLVSSGEMEQSPSLSGSTEIALADNKDVNITQMGTYVVRGKAKNSTISVNAENNSEISIVLDGVNVSNVDFPVIYVKNAGKVSVVTTENSENKLEVTGSFRNDGDAEADGVILSSSDLILKGRGSLGVTSSKGNAIISKNKLKVTGGKYVINSAKHAFEAYNGVIITGGDFGIKAGKDAFHSENSDDNSAGYVYVSDGIFNISAEDDGIQATTFAIIDGGTFKIDAAEGIEATHVMINEGNIDVQASDDGINAAQKSSAYNIMLEVNGGKIDIAMAEGDTDAFDSNGDLTINGGHINIRANSPFDFDGTGRLNGGTVIVNGSQVTQLTNQFFGRPFRGRGNGR